MKGTPGAAASSTAATPATVVNDQLRCCPLYEPTASMQESQLLLLPACRLRARTRSTYATRMGRYTSAPAATQVENTASAAPVWSSDAPQGRSSAPAHVHSSAARPFSTPRDRFSSMRF